MMCCSYLPTSPFHMGGFDTFVQVLGGRDIPVPSDPLLLVSLAGLQVKPFYGFEKTVSNSWEAKRF